jgi:biopolymer transport protein ExbB
MRFIADNCRVGVLSCLLFAFALSCVAATVLLSTPATARAQDEEKKAEEPATPKSTNPVVHFFVSIGIMFGLIFAAISVGMVALIILLVLDLRLGEAVPTAFVDDFTNMVNKRQFKQAYDLCKSDSSFLARVLTAGMGRLQYGIEDAREAMMGMIETVKSSKDSWISYLATIGTLGPMLGLVGTVSGMVGAFRKLGETDAPKPSELAGEISHALVVTLVGVAISVPAIFFYTFFKNRLTGITTNVTNLADDLLTQMYHNSRKAGGAATPTMSAEKGSTGVRA